MSLRIRRGLNSQRSSVLLDTGEIAWATDTKKLYVGDGSTSGGVHILATSIDETSGLAWDNTTQKIKYTGALASALSNIVEDLSPELGGNLNLNNRTINGTGTINFVGGITASTLNLATGLSANLPLNNRDINGAGNINITGTIISSGTVTAGNISTAGTLTASTGLGGNLSLNNYTIGGTGTINISGNITATQYVGNYNTISGAPIINGTTRAATFSTITMGVNGAIICPALLINSPTVSFVTNAFSASQPYVNFYAASSTSEQTGSIGLIRSRGTTISPTVVLNGDEIGSIVTSAFSGTQFTLSTDIVSVVDGAVSAGVVPSRMDFKVTNSLGTTATAMSVKPTQVEFAVPPTLPVIADDTQRSTAISAPTKGMLILMTAGTTPAATNKMQVYDGTDWVNLH
jgi:hypothetical protein